MSVTTAAAPAPSAWDRERRRRYAKKRARPVTSQPEPPARLGDPCTARGLAAVAAVRLGRPVAWWRVPADISNEHPCWEYGTEPPSWAWPHWRHPDNDPQETR